MRDAALDTLEGVVALRGTPYLIDFRKPALGKGSFGEVRLAYNRLDPQQSLCCKIQMLTNDKRCEQTCNEIEVLQLIPQHENLVHTVKANMNSLNAEFIIMERCKGGDLAKYIQESDEISEDEVAMFLQQFISGYYELYSRDLLHCDLKPDNILIHRNKYKITDFGMTTMLKYKGYTIQPKGNFLMRAPELYGDYKDRVLYGQPEIDYSKIDMFSLGCLIYTMLYKEECHPYLGFIKDYPIQQDVNKFCRFVNSKKNVIFPEYPPRSDEIKQLITKLVDKNIATRMSFPELQNDPFSLRINPLNNSMSLMTSRLSMNQTVLGNSQTIFKSIDIQPRVIGSDLIGDSWKFENRQSQMPVIQEVVSERESDSIMGELSQQQMNRYVDEMEERLAREDEKNKRIFAILDSALYERQLVYFIDKLASHLDVLQMNLKLVIDVNKNKDMLVRIDKLKFALICLAIEMCSQIFIKLNSEYTHKELLEFKETHHFEQFLAMQKTDYQALEIFKSEVIKGSRYLTQNIFLKIKLTATLFQDIFSEFNDMYDAMQKKKATKILLVAFWYIFQARKLFEKTSDFNREPKFKLNSNYFSRYYEKIDHKMDEKELFSHVRVFLEKERYPVMINFEDTDEDEK